MAQEYPPTGIVGGLYWNKDPNITSAGIANYSYKITNASYGNGWYVTSANAAYAYSNSTTYSNTEWPPSGAFDKQGSVLYTSPGWHADNIRINNTVDASNPPTIYIKLPQAITLSSHTITLRADCCTTEAPTKWNIHGANDVTSSWLTASWTLVQVGSNTSAWTTIGQTQTLTVTTSTAYNAYRFQFLRNNNANIDFLSLAEIRLYGTPTATVARFSQVANDEFPSAVNTMNSFGILKTNPVRFSALRGLAGLPLGNIRMSDFLAQNSVNEVYNPNNFTFFPTVPFRLLTTTGSYMRMNTSTRVSSCNAASNHIYMMAEYAPGTNNMYYLRDMSSSNYLKHEFFVMNFSNTPVFSQYAYRAVPVGDAQSNFYIRSEYTWSSQGYFLGRYDTDDRFGIFLWSDARLAKFTFDTNDMPPITSGLVGLYTAESFNGVQWTDISGCNNHVTTLSGTIQQSRTLLARRDCLLGGTTSGMKFPTSILPTNYTLFHVTKYNGSNQKRIFQGNTINWLSGFWMGNTGVAYHGNWIASTNVNYNTEWILSSDTNNLYRSQKVNRVNGVTGTTNDQLTINSGVFSNEVSDWGSACVIAYNRNLSLPEIIEVENWLTQKYITTSFPPTQYGLVGYYTAESWTGTQWTDLSGFGNHVTSVSGTITKNYSTYFGRDLIGGTTTSILVWPSAILPETYTMFHVTRYNTGSNRRIFQGSNINWLSGHWNGRAGVAFHNNWITSNGTDNHGTNWVLSTDQNALYRSQGIDRTIATPGTPSYAQLAINTGTYAGETSDWLCACVIVYNRTLSLDEINLVEAWLGQRYTFVGYSSSDTTVLAREDPPTNGIVCWLDAQSHIQNTTIWIDQSYNATPYTFTVNSNACRYTPCPHMDFSPSFNQSIAKRTTNLPVYNASTIITFTTISRDNVNSNRTLIKGSNGDNQIFALSNTHNLGLYNVTNNVFYPTGFDLTNLPSMSNVFNMMVFKLSLSNNMAYQFSHGLNDNVYTIYNSNALLKTGFCTIGGQATNGDFTTATPSNAAQLWGKVGTFLYYNRYLNSAELLDVYNQYRLKYNYPHPGDTRYIDTGAWNVLYELVQPIRTNASGYSNLVYTKNNSAALQNTNFNRVAYYMHNRVNNNDMYFVYVSMDSYSSNILDYVIPDLENKFINQRNTSNLRIFSNHPQVGNYQVINGRLEITSGNCETTGVFGDGSSTVYDFDDTLSIVGTYGCVQVHDMTNKETLLAWNNHAATSNTRAAIGIGNNDATNIHYIVGNTDWTSFENGAYDWKFQVLVNTVGFADALSATAREAYQGAYAVCRTNSSYTGPTFRIRRGSDNVIKDFYADEAGNLGLLLGGRGQSLVNWLNGSTGYVTIWYDQSGRGNHGTQTSNAWQPTIDIINKQVSFRTYAFLKLPDGTVPYNNDNYTVVANINTNSSIPLTQRFGGAYLASGTTGIGNNTNSFEYSSNVFRNYWWANDIGATPLMYENNIVTFTYDNTIGRKMYLNGTYMQYNSATNRSSTKVYNRIGADRRQNIDYVTNSNLYFNGDLSHIHVFRNVLSDNDRALVENSRSVITTNVTLWYDPYDYRCYSGTGTTLTDLSGNNNTGTLSGGASVANTSFVLNGSPQYINTSYNPNFDNNTLYTFELWFKDDAPGLIGGSNTNLISNYGINPVQATNILHINIDGSLLIWERNASSVVNSNTYPINICNNTWRHIVKVGTSNEQILYLDGVRVASCGRPGGVITSGQSIVIGGNHLSRFQTCSIGTTRIYYNKALTATEVYHNYQAEKKRFTSIITSGLTLWYDPGKNATGNTTLADLSGSGNTGTLSGGASIDAATSTVFLNGSPQCITTTYAPNLDNNTLYTFETWFKDDAFGVTNGTLAPLITNISPTSNLTGTSSPQATLAIGGVGRVNIYENTTGGIGSQGQVCDNAWHHIVKVANSQLQLLYIDGSLIGSQPRPGGVITTGSPLTIGGGGSNSYQTCYIGPVRVYVGKALTQEEVLNNYNIERKRFAFYETPTIDTSAQQFMKLTNIAFWMDATRVDLISMNSAYQITSIMDASGKGRNLVTQTAAFPLYNATLTNGRPGFDFTTGAGLVTQAFTNSLNATIAFVITVKSGIGNWGNFFHHGSRDVDISLERYGTTSSLNWQTNNDNTNGFYTYTVDIPMVVICTIANGTSRTMQVTTTSGGTTTTSATNTLSMTIGSKAAYIGRSDFSEACNSHINEIIYYQYVLSSYDIGILNAYLRNKYSI